MDDGSRVLQCVQNGNRSFGPRRFGPRRFGPGHLAPGGLDPRLFGPRPFGPGDLAPGVLAPGRIIFEIYYITCLNKSNVYIYCHFLHKSFQNYLQIKSTKIH